VTEVTFTRRSKVYDAKFRVWVAPVVGYWDRLGRTCCLACPPSDALRDTDVYADNSAADGQRCEFCHTPLLADVEN
jgi:hypothetical protein